jgi:hypothetical protein
LPAEGAFPERNTKRAYEMLMLWLVLGLVLLGNAQVINMRVEGPCNRDTEELLSGREGVVVGFFFSFSFFFFSFSLCRSRNEFFGRFSV